ncbi:MAG: hypothetical protein Kow0092_32260 [Deferrisomatales bacterium]
MTGVPTTVEGGEGGAAPPRRTPLWLWAVGVLLVQAAAASAHPRVEVIRVVDGDTVVVRREGRRETVRLLGVDTPERGRQGRPGEPYARAAERFTRRLLARAERVELQVAGDRVDAHGRTLGFLWLTLPGRDAPVNLSEALLAEGLAKAIRHFDYPGKGGFLELEARARREGRGLWTGRRNPPF